MIELKEWKNDEAKEIISLADVGRHQQRSFEKR